jgi:transposase
MWTEITRRKYERGGQRYASDLTDGEWALIEPHMPAAKPLGRPREIELRAVLDAILYIARTGCQWRMLPKDFPPFTTVQGYFYDWRDNSLFETINFTLLLQAREAAGREASPTAGVIGQDDRERWAAWLRCGQEGQGPQATHCDRYWRSAGRCRGAPRRYPRSRWGGADHRGHPPAVSLAAPPVRRQRL